LSFDEDVLSFDVPMSNILVIQETSCTNDVLENADGFCLRNMAVLANMVLERAV